MISSGAALSVFVLVLVNMAEGGDRFPDDVTVRVCGTQLRELVVQVCGGNLYSPTAEEIDGISTSTTIRDTGITHNCCDNRCSFKYLKGYCAADNDEEHTVHFEPNVTIIGNLTEMYEKFKRYGDDNTTFVLPTDEDYDFPARKERL